MPSMAPKSIPPPPLGTLIDDGQGALELVSVLGCGGYGVVYRARDTSVSYPSFSAVKCLMRATSDPTSRQRQLHLREIALHQLASPHPHVVSVQRVIDPPNSPYTFLVMDYCPDGDLFSMILHKRRYLGNDRLIKHVFLQLLDAVEYCHKLGIYHRDLKPENVLCFEDGLDLAITDFGLATTDRLSSEFRTGSVYHMSPECQGGSFAQNGKYSPPANDVWSLGIILLNLCTGRNPWSSASTSDATFSAYVSSPTNFLTSVLPISRHLNSLMTDVLDIDWTKRISLKDFRMRLKKIDSFYADDAIFEGSMARCPWEVGLNLGGDDEEQCISCTPAVPSETFVEAESRITGRKDTAEPKSCWSSYSNAESEIVFARPASDETSTSISPLLHGPPRPNDGMDVRQQELLVSPKVKPKLKLQIDVPKPKPKLVHVRDRTPGSGHSSFTFTFNISSRPSLRSPSPDYPMTPTDGNYHDESLLTDTTIISPSSRDPASAARSNSTSLSASFHTGFDGDSLEDSIYSNPDIVRILPTPVSEKKGYDYGDYSQRYMRSVSPSPESWHFRTLPHQDWMDTDGETDSIKPYAEVADEDSDSVEDVEDDRVLAISDLSLSHLSSTVVQEDAVEMETQPYMGSSEMEDDFTAFGQSDCTTSWVFPVSNTPPSGSSQFAWSPISEDVVNRQPSVSMMGLGLDLCGRNETPLNWANGPAPQEMEGSSWTHTWSALFSEEAQADHSSGEVPERSSSLSPSWQSAVAVQDASHRTPSPSPAVESWHMDSPVKDVYTVSVNSQYSGLSTFPHIPFSKSRSPTRSFLKFRRPFSFSFHGHLSTPRAHSAPSVTYVHASGCHVPRWSNCSAFAAFSPSARTNVLTTPLPRRKSLFSSGYRSRPRDHARSRLWMKGRSKSLNRSPSPRGMLRIARNWLTGTGPARLFERVVPVTTAA